MVWRWAWFLVNSGVTANLKGLMITYGSPGIQNNGTLTIINSIIKNNVEPPLGGGLGGGISNTGTLILTGSTLSDNIAYWDGGGAYNAGTMTITDSTVSNNDAHMGGGVYNDQYNQLTIQSSTFLDTALMAAVSIAMSMQ